MREYKIHFKTIITSKSFWFCLLIAVGLCFLSSSRNTTDGGFISVFEEVFLNYSINGEKDFMSSYDVLIRSTPDMYAVVFLPVICVMPGVFLLLDEEDSGYSLFSLIRTSKKNREYSWMLAHISSVVILFVVSYIVFIIILAIKQPPLSAFTDEIALMYQQRLSSGYEVTRICGLIAYGVVVAVISLFLLKFLRDRQMVLTALFSLVYLYSAILMRVIKRFSSLEQYDLVMKYEALLPAKLMNIFNCDNTQIIVFMIIMLMLITTYMIFVERRKISK